VRIRPPSPSERVRRVHSLCYVAWLNLAARVRRGEPVAHRLRIAERRLDHAERVVQVLMLRSPAAAAPDLTPESFAAELLSCAYPES
jgi:hypothetical protein